MRNDPELGRIVERAKNLDQEALAAVRDKLKVKIYV